MILLGLATALCGLLILLNWAMARLRRGQVLQLLAVLMKRQMPLESTLGALSQARTAASEEHVIQRLASNMSRGASLPLALYLTRVVTPQQAVVLLVAERRGVAHTALARLADQATEMERRLAASEINLVYPVAIGFALILQVAFLNVFIVPRFQMLFKEMEITVTQLDGPMTLGSTLMYGLFIWGLLAITLQLPRIGRGFWRLIPGGDVHFRMAEQASFARNLGLLLSSGATLEESIDAIAHDDAAGPFRSAVVRINAALKQGEPIVAAFSTAAWRPEFMWAIGSIAQGVAPGPCLEQVAQVLEDKARARLLRIHRLGMPIALLITGAGVGLVGYAMFGGLMAMAGGIR